MLNIPARASGDATLAHVLDQTRQTFVATFCAQCDSMAVLVDKVAALGAEGPVAALTQVVHRMSGLAGTIGFPTVSARAAELEESVHAGGDAFDAARARDRLDAVRAAFAADAGRPPEWPAPVAVAKTAAKILVAEDEADQRAVVMACLEGAAYVPIGVASGDLVVSVARAEKPALILLDIAMPHLDGYSVCRLLKADPDLAAIPVIFMTTGANLDDRVAGVMLGADEFLHKPIDMRELVMRIQLLLERKPAWPAPAAGDAPCELTYDAFLTVARAELVRSHAALAIVRVPAARHDEAARVLAKASRGRDTVGAYAPTRLLIVMPELTAPAAVVRLELVVDRLVALGFDGICAGVTATPAAGGKSAEVLIGEADEAVAEARYLGDKTAIWSQRPGRTTAMPAGRTVVIAEDDPDVARILDPLVRATGHKAIMAFDGERALAAVRAHAPDVLVLDLMMPKLDGFEVLTEIRDGAPPRPRIIVVSARGREEDVVRAFELGADDYMTKPFNPQELMARIARLLT